MLWLARLDDETRYELIRATAADTHMSPGIVEKDFWVCIVLDELFNRSEYASKLTFKGGTSLSKAYSLIQRFSEDVDLILDWREIGYGSDEPWEQRSNTKQDKFKLDGIERTNLFLKKTFAPHLEYILERDTGRHIPAYTNATEETVWVTYPRMFEVDGPLSEIKLEIGPMAAWTPAQDVVIQPYVSSHISSDLGDAITQVRTVTPERTFWEKVSILHQETWRPPTKDMPKRYSRHYYDLYRISQSEVLDSALKNLWLLAKVVEFKEKFYRTPWSRLDLCRPPTLRLVPEPYRHEALAEDYERMRVMLFGDIPTLEEIFEALRELEQRINALPKGLLLSLSEERASSCASWLIRKNHSDS